MRSIPLEAIAAQVGIPADAVEPCGRGVGKIDLSILRPGNAGKTGKVVLITAMTPTSHGEGKTVTTIGLSMALNRKGRRAIACLRQPSLGPVFGLKGGAAGGGRVTVEPFQEINLGFTGDIFAIGASHMLLSAMVDNHLFQGNKLQLDPKSISWPRTVDMDDRALRHIIVAPEGRLGGVQREDSFVITAASEVMAVLGLARDYADLKMRLGNIVVGARGDGSPVTARNLEAQGAMATILRNALRPNLVATSEGTPAMVHGGPFANIAHGTASLVSILLALQQAEFCVVESGFASDLGAEKFVDIVSRAGGFSVSAAVIVTTIRALRHHGGVPEDDDGAPSVEATQRGLANLQQHIENVQAYGTIPVVALNSFPGDSPEEVRLVRQHVEDQGVSFAASTGFKDGSAGVLELAERVLEAVEKGRQSRPLYALEDPIERKVERIVTTIYGGQSVEWTDAARTGLQRAAQLGLARSPVCIAKTHLSLSDDSKKWGRPRGFVTTAKGVRSSVGAGFAVVLMGSIVTMPGLPERPQACSIDLTDDGKVVGLY